MEAIFITLVLIGSTRNCPLNKFEKDSFSFSYSFPHSLSLSLLSVLIFNVYIVGISLSRVKQIYQKSFCFLSNNSFLFLAKSCEFLPNGNRISWTGFEKRLSSTDQRYESFRFGKDFFVLHNFIFLLPFLYFPSSFSF